jgi:peptidyl-Asp metalloendopeptidase
MVLWTTQAECALTKQDLSSCTLTSDTENSMRALIDQAVSQTNMSLQQSGALMTLTLMHAYHVDYTETTALDALAALASKVDDIMDDMHTIRSRYKADYVALILSTADTCGNSYLGYPKTHAGLLFSVVPYDCAVEGYSFAHEFGHVNGCDHDRGYADMCASEATNFGYRSPVAPIRDIMATQCVTNECDASPYSACSRVLRYSHNGNYVENGVDRGPIGDAMNDCVSQINLNRKVVADASENLSYIPPIDRVTTSTFAPRSSE